MLAKGPSFPTDGNVVRYKTFKDWLNGAVAKLRTNKEFVSGTWSDYDMSELVTPRMYRPDQIKMLSYLFPKKEVDALKLMASMINSGLTNYSCPPPELPYLTEEYVGPDGVKRCRAPIDTAEIKEISEDAKHGCPPDWDPLAIEAFVDAKGVLQCRRPIMYGETKCEADKMLVVTDRGFGKCVDPTEAHSVSNLGMTSLIQPANLGEILGKDLKALVDTGVFRLDTLRKLNNLFLSYRDTRGLIEAIRMDPDLHKFEKIASKIGSRDDARLYNIALYMFMLGSRNFHPDFDDWKRFFGMSAGTPIGETHIR